jgi:hypothetical protein
VGFGASGVSCRTARYLNARHIVLDGSFQLTPLVAGDDELMRLASIRFQPDVAFKLTHGEDQRTVPSREAGQEPAAADLT